MTAGLDRKRVVLLVDAAHLIWHDPTWTTLVELMRDGKERWDHISFLMSVHSFFRDVF